MLKRGLFGGVLLSVFCLNGSTVVTSLSVRPGDDLQAAVLNVRKARKSGEIPTNRMVRLVLGEGVYRLAKPLFLTEEDSHIRIEAEKTGEVVISGGLEMPPFTQTDCGLWRTVVPAGIKFCQLWVNGRFATRARMPNEGFAYMQSPCEEAVDPNTGMVVDQSKGAFVCEAQEADALVRESKIGDLGNVFARIYQMWVTGIHRIVSFNPESRVVRIAPETERPTLNGWGMTTRYVLENLRIALDAPGEWYHDAKEGELLYMPREGEALEGTKAVIPVASKIVQVRGNDIAFKGLTFANCGYDVSNGEQGVQAQYKTPAAVEVVDSEGVDFVSCSFCCLAPVCLRVGEGCRKVTVSGSLFEEFGVGGVYIGSWTRKCRPTSLVSVTDTVIRDGGRIMDGGVGVWIGFASDVDVCHNEICGLGYSGVSSGWVWGYADTPTARIRLNYNYIHDLGRCILSDMGGIYTLGRHPDSEVIGNHIHDIWSSDVDGRGAWGLYADEGTSGMRFESNLVYRTKTGSFHQHFGKGNVIRNNIFAHAREYPVERSRIEDHLSFAFENNIVVWTNETQAVRSRKTGDLKKTTSGLAFDRNIYFNPNGVGGQAFHGYSFSDWQACGMDRNGVIADPLLEDPANGKWMPSSKSPAWKIGFKAFDPGEAGVRTTTADPAWAGLERRSYPRPVLPDPLPLTHRESYANDFEGYANAMLPKAFKYQCPKNSVGKGGVRIVPVADARHGHALEFTDAADLPQRGVPHVSGYFGATSGVYTVAFSVCAEKGAEMDFSVRGETPDLPLGVLVRYVGDVVSVNGASLAHVPTGTWWRLSVSINLDDPVRRWLVKVEQKGGSIAQTSVPSKDSRCVVPGWFGWNSNAECDARFWIDDVTVRTTHERCSEPVVIIPRDAGKAIRFAADEFAKYHCAVTGRRLTVDTVVRNDRPCVRIDVDSSLFPGETDAYKIVSKDNGLLIVGRNGRSAIYGVYDFFSRRCGCKWFWDGDVVPKAGKIDLKGMDVFEQSRFEFRGCQYFAHRSLKRFQAELWGIEDWKREIDWALKSRLNVIMLQTGIEDLFQKAFPDIVSTPDPDVTAETDGGPGYNIRTPFWSLSYRNLLRKAVLGYATDRGLMHPVVYGPRTHWYSRTPKDFLEKAQPDFMPQEIEHYSEPSGRLWDMRQDRWFEAYWKLTEASVAEYGYSGLLFNPGFDERILYTNRTANATAKIKYLEKFNREAARRYPDARLLIEGWDFFGQWSPDEVRRFVDVADPARTVIWNYTSDEDDTSGAPGVPLHNNFTLWGVTNRFPYVFGSMIALNRASDIRGNYEKMRQRAELVRDDPMCKGYILWPEMSHGDIFAWRFFTENCWEMSRSSVDSLLVDFCRDRYGAQAESLLPIWRKVIRFASKQGWDRIFTCNLIDRFNAEGYVPQRNDAGRWLGARKAMGDKYADIPAAEIFTALNDVKWEGCFIRRDTIDLARTTLDRVLYAAMEDVMEAYYGVRQGKSTLLRLKRLAESYVETMRCMVDVLELHGDFSVSETWDAINAVEKVRNPKGERLLFENSACSYCRGFQSEYVRSMFLPLAEEIMSLLVHKAEKSDFSPLPQPSDVLAKMRSCEHPILSFRPVSAKRTPAWYRKVMRRCAEVTSDASGCR